MGVELSNNRRIAKNAIALYVRMLLSTLITLYTSRVVLDMLGVEDFGIYALVGGVVAMLGFLNAAMSGATSRFLTFELAKGDSERLRDTFNSAMIIHIGIALLVFVVAETAGLWFVNTQLVIPEERLVAANWAYQFSVFAAMVGITQVPYNADIIANEKMDIYAYVEMLNVGLKLGVVYLLVIGVFDKLILYALLILCVSIIIAMIYRVYCLRHFQESRLRWVWDTTLLKPMLAFSGWDLYGNMSVTVRQQGLNVLLNLFFGPVVNAASSIATTVNGAVNGLATNIIVAFRPQIIKNYSCGQMDSFFSIMANAVIFSTSFLVAISIPLYLEMDMVLRLWLGQIPDYVIGFVRIILITNVFGVINSVVTVGIHSTGNIKNLSIVSGSLYLLTLPITYLLLKLGCSANWAYMIYAIMMVLILVTNLSILKRLVKAFDLGAFLIVILRILIMILLGIAILYPTYSMLPQSFVRLLIMCATSVVTIAILMYLIVMGREQRQSCNRYIGRILFKKRR